MKTYASVLALLGVAAFLQGAVVPVRAEAITTLVAPAHPVSPGATVTIELARLNRGDAPLAVTHAAVLPAVLTAGGRSWPVELRATPTAETSVAPRGFALQGYTLALPAAAAGPATLQVSLPGTTPLQAALEIADAAPSSAKTKSASPEALARATRVAEADATVLGRTFAGRLNAHEPIYFIYGSGSQAAKFQLSFKYKAATFSDDPANGVLNTLQLAYTQRSLWDIAANSSPFYDTSYQPEVFWEWYNVPQPGEAERGTLLGFQTGLRHESNGRDGLDSRSSNIAYLRAVFTLGPTDGWNFRLIPEVWAYGSLDDNPTMDDYRGYGRLQGIFGRADSAALRFSVNTGKQLDHLTYQLDFTVPLRVKLLDMSAFFHVQYFNGYGESLRAFDRKSEALRAGFSLSR